MGAILFEQRKGYPILPKKVEEKTMRREGLTRIELLVVIALVALSAGIIGCGLGKVRLPSYRMGCRSNLKGIGKAMLLYSQDNDGSFPVSGGPGAIWSPLGSVSNIGWLKGFSEEKTFGRPGKNKAMITSCLYLLVRYGMATPKQFVCEGDGATTFRLSLFKLAPSSIYDTWDFGDGQQVWAGACCSYSYHMPFSFPDPRGGREGALTNLAINQKSPDDSPVCADRNPFLDENLAGSEPDIDDNCYAHGGDGQNVLYKDMHVDFESTPRVGIGENNIWAYFDGSADQPPKAIGDEGPPFSARDSYLVNERQSMPEWWRRRR